MARREAEQGTGPEGRSPGGAARAGRRFPCAFWRGRLETARGLARQHLCFPGDIKEPINSVADWVARLNAGRLVRAAKPRRATAAAAALPVSLSPARPALFCFCATHGASPRAALPAPLHPRGRGFN